MTDTLLGQASLGDVSRASALSKSAAGGRCAPGCRLPRARAACRRSRCARVRSAGAIACGGGCAARRGRPGCRAGSSGCIRPAWSPSSCRIFMSSWVKPLALCSSAWATLASATSRPILHRLPELGVSGEPVAASCRWCCGRPRIRRRGLRSARSSLVAPSKGERGREIQQQ